MDPDVLAGVNESLAARGARSAAVTPDGAFLVALTAEAAPTADGVRPDDTARPDDASRTADPTRTDDAGLVVDLATGEAVATVPAHRHLPPTPAADGTTFATYDGEAVQIRNLPDGDLLAAFAVDVSSLAPAGRGLLAPGGDAVYLPDLSEADWTRYDPATGDVVHTYPAPADDEAVTCVALSADGSRAAVAGIKGPVSEGFLAVYDAASGALASHRELPYEVDRVALSPDGSDVVLADAAGGLAGDGWRSHAADVADEVDAADVADEEDGAGDGADASAGDSFVADAQFVRDGRAVVSVTGEGTLDLWDAASGDRLDSTATDGPATSLSATRAGDLVTLSGARPRLVAPGWSA